MSRFRVLTAGLLLCGITGLSVGSREVGSIQGAEKTAPDKAAVERARDQVKMLDTLYKTAVVHMTKYYVGQQGEVPAAVVAGEVFEAMKKNGFHEARLIDISGKPKRKQNVAKSEFEKKAADVIKNGKPYFEEIGEKDGKPVFRAATVVPAVMKECAVCHRVKEGDLLGAIVYELPIK